MVTFYHGTSRGRVESILESGLIPPKCRQPVVSGDKCGCQCDEYQHGNFNYRRGKLRKNFGFVYFTKEATDALLWSNRNGASCAYVVLAAEIPKADVELDPLILGAWRTRGPIPPERISIVDLDDV